MPEALPALKKLATETSDVYAEDTEQAGIQSGQLDASFMYEADANSQGSPFVKLTGVSLAGDYTVTMRQGRPAHRLRPRLSSSSCSAPPGSAEMKTDQFGIVSPAKVTGSGVPSGLTTRLK